MVAEAVDQRRLAGEVIVHWAALLSLCALTFTPIDTVLLPMPDIFRRQTAWVQSRSATVKE